MQHTAIRENGMCLCWFILAKQDIEFIDMNTSELPCLPNVLPQQLLVIAEGTREGPQVPGGHNTGEELSRDFRDLRPPEYKNVSSYCLIRQRAKYNSRHRN